MPDSSTIGYLAPSVPSPPIEGKELYRFFHDVVMGITELDKSLVRPRWNAEPADIPDEAVAWAGVGFGRRPSDTFPQIVHNGGGDGSDTLQRQEGIEVKTSFYDLGSEGQADALAAKLRDGLAIEQNRSVMALGGFLLGYVGEPIPAPVVMKTRWLYRVDFDFFVRRQIDRTYAVLNILSFNGILYAQNSVRTLTETLNVEP